VSAAVWGRRRFHDDDKLKGAAVEHLSPHARCGPKDALAQIDSPLSASHKHARARLLIVSEVINDIWQPAYRLHGWRGDSHVERSQRRQMHQFTAGDGRKGIPRANTLAGAELRQASGHTSAGTVGETVQHHLLWRLCAKTQARP
jgi:hypothetical protein